MNRIRLVVAPVCGLFIFTAACSPEPQPSGNASSVSNAGALNTPQASDAKVGSSVVLTADADVLAVEGFAGLKIGEPVPGESFWAERGAQAGEACRTVSSPDYPGAYAIVIDGKVQRITLGKRSTAKLAEGIGTGASEVEVRRRFAGFREAPHTYQDAPAKYLTAPNAQIGSSTLRFEIGQDGTVNLIHVGVMPALAFVEGCA